MSTNGTSRGESAESPRLERVLARAGEMFADLDLALAWLKAPIAALEGATPLSLIDTDDGVASVDGYARTD